MSISVYEKHKSPRAKVTTGNPHQGSTIDFTYVVLGTTSELEAANAALSAAPLVYLVNDEVLVRQEVSPEVTGPESWEVTVHYGPEDEKQSEEPPEPGTWQFSFDTTGGTHKITQSLQTLWKGERSLSNPAPDLRGAINYDGKKVAGVEMVVPKLEFSITAYYRSHEVTTAFMRNVARHTGKVSNDAWLGFAAGEILFLGGTGQGDIPLVSGQRVKPVSVTVKFAASENRQNIKVGEIIVPEKKGWQYLWVKYEKLEENGLVFPVPVHAYVEQIYPETAFRSLFGFG
jgi:hypothetical protein